jgi:hypothetical protein
MLIKSAADFWPWRFFFFFFFLLFLNLFLYCCCLFILPCIFLFCVFIFLARSLIWHSFLFLIELFLSFSTIDGQLSSPFSTTDGRVGNPLGFCFIYGILPFITVSFGHFYSLDRSSHLFYPFPIVIRTSLSISFVFL